MAIVHCGLLVKRMNNAYFKQTKNTEDIFYWKRPPTQSYLPAGLRAVGMQEGP